MDRNVEATRESNLSGCRHCYCHIALWSLPEMVMQLDAVDNGMQSKAFVS